MYDYRCRSFLQVLSPLLDAPDHFLEIFEVTWIRDHIIVLPPCRLQMSDHLYLTVECRCEFEYALSDSLRFLRYAYLLQSETIVFECFALPNLIQHPVFG